MDLSVSDIRLKLSPALISRVMEIVEEVVNDPTFKKKQDKPEQKIIEPVQQKILPPEKPWLPKKVFFKLYCKLSFKFKYSYKLIYTILTSHKFDTTQNFKQFSKI